MGMHLQNNNCETPPATHNHLYSIVFRNAPGIAMRALRCECIMVHYINPLCLDAWKQKLLNSYSHNNSDYYKHQFQVVVMLHAGLWRQWKTHKDVDLLVQAKQYTQFTTR